MIDVQKQQWLLYILPIVLLISCALVFKWAATAWGQKWGYFTGFLFYWLIWCIVVPVSLAGIKPLIELFHSKNVVWNGAIIACLLIPLVFVYAYAFPAALQTATLTIVIFSLLLSIVNATLEEVLWRGTYLIIFQNQQWLFLLASSIGFAIWHYAPQVVFPNTRPGGTHSFVLFSFVLGFIFGWAAWKQHSLFWVTIAHILFDFAGLGARLYFT
ncbi:MAG: CPBP family intramembrane metalloprotease [Flavisolibacter sp.]|nr:CPBP family intramembrane metalloprotease [Flavisolibacter sp.]